MSDLFLCEFFIPDVSHCGCLSTVDIYKVLFWVKLGHPQCACNFVTSCILYNVTVSMQAKFINHNRAMLYQIVMLQV